MINQMGQLPDVPTTKELWKKEKSSYRHWMILFSLGILAVTALLLASAILNWTSSENIKNVLSKQSNGYFAGNAYENGIANASYVNRAYMQHFILMPVLQLCGLSAGLLMFFLTLFKSYQEKSFAYISQFSTLVIGIGALLGFIELFQMIWSSSAKILLDKNIRGAIFQFVNYILMIAVYIGSSRQVANIKRQFLIAKRIETLKNDPQYQAQMQQMQQMMQNGQFGTMGSFGPQSSPQNIPNQNSATSANNGIINQTQNVEPEISKEEKELRKMKVDELILVAKKLNISGSKTMKKQELIDAILRATNK